MTVVVPKLLNPGVGEVAITIWPWDRAPSELRVYSENDGDEDGVAWIPTQIVAETWWLERLWNGLDSNPTRIEFLDGVLIIWAHA